MSESLTIESLGHACFALTTDDHHTLLVDPHAPNLFGGLMDYPPITTRVDAVLCTHDHLDHCATATLQHDNPALEILSPEVTRWRSWSITRVVADHDEHHGNTRGGQVDILKLCCGPWTIVHLSDVGQAPTRSLVSSLRCPDLLIVPVGGFYTIGAAQAWAWCQRLDPRCILPMHFRTPYCRLPLLGPELFAAYSTGQLPDIASASPASTFHHADTLPPLALLSPRLV